MEFENFLELTGHLPFIDTESLRIGAKGNTSLEVQLSRWKKSGKLIQLRRGLYLVSETYRKTKPFEPAIAATLNRPSYISLEKALEYHGLIPEAVHVFTSVTTKRPREWQTPLGVFDYRHIRENLFWGYHSVTMNGQTAFMASPEKALLDFFYLKSVPVNLEYLEEMRLQNFEKISPETLLQMARRFAKPRMLKIAKLISEYVLREQARENSV